MSGLIFKIHIFLTFAAGHQPAADHILDPFEIFGLMVALFDGSMVPWFDGHRLQRCGALCSQRIA